MPTVLREPPAQPAPMVPPRKRWTRDECAALETLGIWDQEKLELVEGELISKMGKKRPHVNAMMLVQNFLMGAFGSGFVNSEAPIDVAPEDNPTNEPQPDLIVLTRPSREIRTNPRPADLRLVVEIADSTVNFDLGPKAVLYARASITEYWVVEIPERRIIVHREPRDGRYQSVTAFTGNEQVSALGDASHVLRVSEVFD